MNFPAPTPTPARSWDEYLVVIGDQVFRPISAGSLMMLYDINSPIMFGGTCTGVDFAAFAWLHAAPLSVVQASIAAGKWKEDAMNWAAAAPVEVFSSFTADRIKQLVRDVGGIFADRKTGYIPFPAPSPCRRTWKQRVLTFILRPFARG